MKIAYKHLLNLLPEKPSVEDVSKNLFQLGHEHEIENNIFDMEFTPNRGDCLSILGLVRDLNIFYETVTDFSLYNQEIPSFDLNFINQAPEKCPEISFLHIEIEGKISEYDTYLENYFKDLKINKINFFTDVSNYVAYEMGQPTHSYDLDKIDSKTPIRLQDNKDFTEFTSLTGKKIELKGSDLVFTNNNKVINLAGIMGGIDTACKENTSNVLIECAYFKSEVITGKAIKYDLHSEASHKFERGVDQTSHDNILRRITHIINEHAKIKKVEIYHESSIPYKEKEISIDLEKINNILGLNISMDRYQESLINLGFKFNANIKVPSYRNDVESQNDLAEEVARVVGYDNITPTEINIPSTNFINSHSCMEDKLKSLLIDNGFYEVINSPFVSASEKGSIKVDNPLDSNKEFLRKNIMDSLVENLLFNEKRQKDSIKLFEISDIYSSDEIYTKTRKVGIIASGRIGKNYKDFSKKIDLDYLSSIFKQASKNPDLNFQVIPRENIISKIKSDIVSLEIKIDNLPLDILEYNSTSKVPSEFIQYSSISEFPSSYRDISYSIDDYSKIEELEQMVLSFKDDNIKDIYIFDFFENTKLNLVKIGFRLIFQSNKKTLEDDDIDKVILKLSNLSCEISGVTIPGMV